MSSLFQPPTCFCSVKNQQGTKRKTLDERVSDLLVNIWLNLRHFSQLSFIKYDFFNGILSVSGCFCWWTSVLRCVYKFKTNFSVELLWKCMRSSHWWLSCLFVSKESPAVASDLLSIVRAEHFLVNRRKGEGLVAAHRCVCVCVVSEKERPQEEPCSLKKDFPLTLVTFGIFHHHTQLGTLYPI